LALSGIDRFVVYSGVEQDLYPQIFSLPANKFDIVLWGIRPPEADMATPFEGGDYICAIGGNARDYETLVEAARQLPHMRFVLVVRPDSLQGLHLPLNITVHVDLSYGAAMNVLKYSRFMVLPLANSSVPCGHVTLVAAMHLAKATIVTDSLGVRDYARDGDNALLVEAGSIESLITAISRLWENPLLCNRLAENGEKFAASECTEDNIVEHFLGCIQNINARKV